MMRRVGRCVLMNGKGKWRLQVRPGFESARAGGGWGDLADVCTRVFMTKGG